MEVNGRCCVGARDHAASGWNREAASAVEPAPSGWHAASEARSRTFSVRPHSRVSPNHSVKPNPHRYFVEMSGGCGILSPSLTRCGSAYLKR